MSARHGEGVEVHAVERDVSRRAVSAAIFMLCVAAALATVLTARLVYPDGSGDLDEASYQAQANTLAAGHLTLPTATHDPAFVPFLSGVRDHRIVFKYQPVWPAMIAASDATTGSSVPARVALSIAGVLSVVWLAWELVRDARVALLAGALFVISPFTWVETASLLGYELSLVLGAAAAAALVRAARTGRALTAVGAGALLGLGALHRPYDMVVAAAPVLVYVMFAAHRRITLLRLAATVAVGALPFLVALGAYNRAVMGSLLRLPYSVSGSIDRFGFGWRASFEVPGGGHGGQIHYTVGRAFATLQHTLATLPRFVAFAPALAICIVVAIWKGRRDARLWLLVAMALAVLAGFFFWWGAANAYHFRLERSLGPFYHYFVLVPLCILGAWGFVRVRSGAARLALVLLAIVWTGPASAIVVQDAGVTGRARSDELAGLTGAGRTLVFQAPLFPNDPYVRYADDADLDDAHVVGLGIEGHRLDTIDRLGARAVSEYRPLHQLHDPFGDLSVPRVLLTVVRGATVRAHLHATADAGHAGIAYLRVGDGTPRFVAPGAGPWDLDFTIAPSLLPPDGRVVTVAAGIATAATGSPPPAMTGQWYECRFEARRTPAGQVEVLAPCTGWHRYEYPGNNATVTPEDQRGLLELQLSAT